MIQEEHRRTLALLEDTEQYKSALSLYQDAVGPVYFRPAADGFTVISLDEEQVGMFGVGGKPDDCKITEWPVTAEDVEGKAERFAKKTKAPGRDSEEECFALSLIRDALSSDLSVGPEGWYFVHQEWRIPLEGKKLAKKLDLLLVHPERKCLGILELKKSEEAARRATGKNGDAWSQAESYALHLRKSGEDTFEFFEKLIRATAVAHDGPDALKNVELNPRAVPRTFVAWPGSDFLPRR